MNRRKLKRCGRVVKPHPMLQLPRKKSDDDRLDGDESTLAMLRALTDLAALLHGFNRPGP